MKKLNINVTIIKEGTKKTERVMICQEDLFNKLAIGYEKKIEIFRTKFGIIKLTEEKLLMVAANK